MISTPCLIILDRPSRDQRELVHKVITRHAEEWWHHFVDVWIASGHDSDYWYDSIMGAVGGSLRLLVIALPDNAEDRLWATSGAVARGSEGEEAIDWLGSVYS
jgi:hypothetical protein